MATSGKINGTVTNKSNIFSFYANWSATQNIDENASYVTVTTYFSTNNTGYKFDTVGNRDASITVDGKKYSVSKRMNCNPWNDSKTYVISGAEGRFVYPLKIYLSFFLSPYNTVSPSCNDAITSSVWYSLYTRHVARA